MDSIDLTVLKGLIEWRKNNYQAALVTVVHTWGSSPRPIGSMMAIREDSRLLGSVSGGCLEDDLIKRYKTFPIGKQYECLTYGVNADEAHQFGLPCGGTVQLIIEFNPDPFTLEQLLQKTQAGHLVQRSVNLATKEVELTPVQQPKALKYDGKTLTHVFGPAYRLLIIGAGQLSEYLATMALFNGFQVTVCDPRKHHIHSWAIKNVEITHEMPDDAVTTFKPNSRSCIVALTHDPKLDDMALLSALESEALYVGAIGSRKNNEARRHRMIEYLDLSPDTVEKLYSPIGIFIGSKTPAEIAVSIMAQIIAVKNGIKLPEKLNIENSKNLLEKPM